MQVKLRRNRGKRGYYFKTIEMDKIKKYLLTKWIEEYIEELREYELVCDESALADLRDLRGDLEICEKVLMRFYSIIDN